MFLVMIISLLVSLIFFIDHHKKKKKFLKIVNHIRYLKFYSTLLPYSKWQIYICIYY